MSRKQKGFTLVELVAVIALLGVVSSLIFSVFVSGSKLYSNGMRIENIETNGRQVMQQVSQDIKTSKVLIGTQDLKNGSGLGYYISSPVYLDNTAIARDDLVAYVENYNSERFIYAFRNIGAKRELYKIILENQKNNHYEITLDSVDQTLNTSDTIKVNSKVAGLSSQDILDSGDINFNLYIDNYSSGHYDASNSWLMYDNDGDDCYLVTDISGERVKRKLKKVFKPNFTVSSEKLIANYIDSILITNNTNNGEIEINISSGDKSKKIKTSVNILNQ